MSLLLAGTGHIFFEPGPDHLYAWDAEEEKAYLAILESQFNWIQEDVNDPIWFMPMTESMLWMQDEEEKYFVSRETSLSFPVAKLGAKTRACTEITVPIVPESRGGIVVGRGTATVNEGESSVTISHGYSGSGVLVFGTPNWNTGYYIASQGTTTVTFGFAVPAPSGGGAIQWEAII